MRVGCVGGMPLIGADEFCDFAPSINQNGGL